MTDQLPLDDDAEAAALAWAILRFDQSVLPPAIASTPSLGGAPLGHVGVTLFPPGKTIPLANVVESLRALPKPVVLASLSARGHLGVWSCATAAAADRPQLEHDFANQLDGLQMYCEQFGLTPDTRVLLETGIDTRVVTISTMTRYLRDYAVLVGWRIKSLQRDARADAQLVLITGGGHQSPGWRDDAPAG